MIADALKVVHWPDFPPLPAPGEPVLVRVPVPRLRPPARRHLRAAARAVLAAWSDCSPSDIVLHETPRGPVVPSTLYGHPVALSFSYSGDTGWIALVRARAIGVDALRVSSFAEMADVARLYLGPDAWSTLAASPDPAAAFARAWTQLEARLKYHRQKLSEWSDSTSATVFPVPRTYVFDSPDTVVTIAVPP